MVITKFRGHLSIVLERASVCLELAENTFARLQKSVADKLKAVRQRSESDLQRLRARSRGSFIVANEVFARLGSQASSASRKAAVQLQKTQEAATGFGRAGVDKVQKLLHDSENDLRKFLAGFRVAIVAADTKIAQLGRQVSSVSRQKLLKAQDAITTLGRTIADKPRRMREVRLTRENDLRSLLASSLDAIVVTDEDRRLVAANEKALELFGISEFNMGNFTVDAFLAKVELPDFDWTDSSFERREFGGSRCKIRRLDGGLRIAECQFVAGIVPRRDLYKFLNVAPYKITPPEFSKRNGSAASLWAGESSSNSVPNATVPAKKSGHGVGHTV
jgi:PAS domain S-box-containing protein